MPLDVGRLFSLDMEDGRERYAGNSPGEAFFDDPYQRISLDNPQLNQSLKLFPNQHHAAAEASNMRKLLGTALSPPHCV